MPVASVENKMLFTPLTTVTPPVAVLVASPESAVNPLPAQVSTPPGDNAQMVPAFVYHAVTPAAGLDGVAMSVDLLGLPAVPSTLFPTERLPFGSVTFVPSVVKGAMLGPPPPEIWTKTPAWQVKKVVTVVA
jgi:hypothetical protein